MGFACGSATQGVGRAVECDYVCRGPHYQRGSIARRPDGQDIHHQVLNSPIGLPFMASALAGAGYNVQKNQAEINVQKYPAGGARVDARGEGEHSQVYRWLVRAPTVEAAK